MGIFDRESNLFTAYRARVQFRDKVMGGTPKDPKLIEGWLRAKAGLTEKSEELRQATLRTLLELGADVRPDMSYADMVEASESLAGSKQTNGFKRDERGLYIEGRTIKAAIKEQTNILYAGERWGTTKKGPRSYVAERVFVDPDHITLSRTEPDGVELFIGHTSGPKGPQSNLTYHEYAERAEIVFVVRVVTKFDLTWEQWGSLWTLAQENGLGALRSQGFGRFDIVEFSPIPLTDALPDGVLAAVH